MAATFAVLATASTIWQIWAVTLAAPGHAFEASQLPGAVTLTSALLALLCAAGGSA